MGIEIGGWGTSNHTLYKIAHCTFFSVYSNGFENGAEVNKEKQKSELIPNPGEFAKSGSSPNQNRFDAPAFASTTILCIQRYAHIDSIV